MLDPEVPWIESPVVDIDYGLPIVDRYLELPEQIAARGRRLLGELLQHIPNTAAALVPIAAKLTANRFQPEIASLAKAVGADEQDILIANLSYDLALSLFGCSTIALPTPSGPIVARNMDWPQEEILAQSSCLLKYMQHGRLKFANAGWPGAVGAVTGLSVNGFAVVLNAVSGPEGTNWDGYPVLLHLRRVLEDATDFDDALEQLSQQKLTSSALITLVGTENQQRVVIERTATRHALRWAEPDRPLVTTNDYRLLYKPTTSAGPEIYQTTCHRFDYLTSFFDDHTSHSDACIDKLLFVLTDSNVLQSITAQHIVLQPAINDIRLFVPRKFVSEN